MDQPYHRVTLLASDLAQKRGSRLLFEHLSFTVEPGDALILTGPNGSGKTTLLRTLAGYLRPLSGSVRLDGAGADHAVGEQCHYVGHLNALKPQFTVRENLSFWCDYLGDGGVAAVQNASERLDLTEIDDIPAGYLSAGQKRRLGLARLLLAPRPLWILDEPTAALDTASAAAVVQLIAEHAAIGGIAVIATHLPLALPRYRELRLGVTETA